MHMQRTSVTTGRYRNWRPVDDPTLVQVTCSAHYGPRLTRTSALTRGVRSGEGCWRRRAWMPSPNHERARHFGGALFPFVWAAVPGLLMSGGRLRPTSSTPVGSALRGSSGRQAEPPTAPLCMASSCARRIDAHGPLKAAPAAPSSPQSRPRRAFSSPGLALVWGDC